MVVPDVTSPYMSDSTDVSAVSHTASAAHFERKGTGKGKGKGKGKGPVDHRPLCLHGSKCENYGTRKGCSEQHTDVDMATMQNALCPEFISRAMRMRLITLHSENRPTAAAAAASTGHTGSMQPPVPRIAPQPPVPEPELSTDSPTLSNLGPSA